MPKILTPDDHERIKQEMLEQLRAMSTDGIAPATTHSGSGGAHNLCVRCKRYWPSWADFCREAGVTPRSVHYRRKHRLPPRRTVKKGDLRRALGYSDLLEDEAYG